MLQRWMRRFWDRLYRAGSQLSETPQTRGYQSFHGYVWGRQPRDLPPFSLTTAQLMLLDPAVRLGLQMRAAPVCSTEIAYREGEQWIPGVRAASEEVGEFVYSQLKKIWSQIDALLPAQTFGWSAGEVTFRLVDGRLEIDELLPAHTIDTRALLRGGEVIGVRVLNVKKTTSGHVDLHFPKCWFHVFDRQPGQVYGLPVLLGAYSPWWDKWMHGGALDVRRMFMHKDAYGGTDMTYPEGTTYIPDRGEVPNRDIARELAEQIVAGGVTARPAQYDERGNELWKLTRATVPSNPEHILKYPRDLDVEIWRGLGIADDVLTSESTGAWAGKRIPMAAFLNGLDIWVTALLRDLIKQILRPLVLMNFGDVRFEVDHKPLAQQGMEQQGETVQGQQAGGGQQQPVSTAAEGKAGGLSGVQINAATGVLADLREGVVPPSVAEDLIGAIGIPGDTARRMVRETRARMSLDPVEAVGRGVLSAAELVKAARRVMRMAGARAPKGGITIGGKHFVGGQFIPEEVLDEATEEEREAIEGDRTGVGFVSPNKSDDEMTVEEAFNQLNSDRHKRMKSLFREIDDALGMKQQQIDIVGDWGGAENSILIEYEQYRDYDELRYAMAWKGLLAEQKAVIVFEEDPDGEQSMFDFEFHGRLSEVRDALSEFGLTERSIAQTASGSFRVFVYDDGTLPEDSVGPDDTRESRINRFSEKHNVRVLQTRGNGEELGVKWDRPREEGADFFRRVIEEYEARWPDRPHYRPPAKMSARPRGHHEPSKRPPLIIGIGRRKGGGHA